MIFMLQTMVVSRFTVSLNEFLVEVSLTTLYRFPPSCILLAMVNVFPLTDQLLTPPDYTVVTVMRVPAGTFPEVAPE